MAYYRVDNAETYTFLPSLHLQLAQNMTADWFADEIRLRINDSFSMPVEYYDPEFDLPADHGTSHLSIVGPNGDAVGLTSTVNL